MKAIRNWNKDPKSGKAFAMISLACFAVACGRTFSSDSPTKSYRDMGPTVPLSQRSPQPTPQPQPTAFPVAPPPPTILTEVDISVMAPPAFFETDANGKKSENKIDEPSFVEGLERSYIFVYKLNIDDVEGEFTPVFAAGDRSPLESGMKFEPISAPSKRSSAYRLSWKAPTGVLGDNERRHNFKFTMRFHVKKNGALGQNAKAVQNADGRGFEFRLRLEPNDSRPQILSSQVAAEEIKLGEADQVTVMVRDESSSPVRKPTLDIRNGSQTVNDVPVIKLADDISFSEPSIEGEKFDHLWKFVGKLETAKIDSLPKSAAESASKVLLGRFVIVAISSNGLTSSSEKSVTVKLVRPLAEPIPVIKKPKASVKPGPTSGIKPGATPVPTPEPSTTPVIRNLKPAPSPPPIVAEVNPDISALKQGSKR